MPMSSSDLVSKLRYLFWKLRSLLTPQKPQSHLCLQPVEREFVQQRTHITNLPPKNIRDLGSTWMPPEQWVELDTNDVYLNVFNDCNVAINGILFQGLCAFAGTYIYPAFYDKYGVPFLLNTYRHSKRRSCNDAYEYLLVHDHWSAYNYFHWICDALPKLYLFKKHFAQKSNVRVFLPADAPKFAIDSVSIMGFEIEFISRAEYVFAKKVYHLDYIVASGFTTPTLLEAIGHILPADRPRADRQVYISRGKAGRRTVANENKLIDLLVKKGFEIHFTETLSFKEQIELFSQTATLVSSHGAGLTNMLFMPKGGSVIELALADTSQQTMCYWAMANAMDLQYSYIPVPAGDGDALAIDDNAIRLLESALESR